MQRDIASTIESKEKRRQRQEELALKNKRLGLTIFQISWIMVFVCIVVADLQLRASYLSWPPEGVEQPSLLLSSLATIALIFSAVLVFRSKNAITTDNVSSFLSQWMFGIMLGLVFLGIMIYQFLTAPENGGVYTMMFRLMVGYHAIHALVIGGMMVYIYRNARQGYYNSENNWAVEGTARLWYFVVVAWLLFYVVLYWL